MSEKSSNRSLIDTAPIDFEADEEPGDPAAELAAANAKIGELTDSLAEIQAELARVQGQSDFETNRARMMEPFAERVYLFVSFYCLAVFALLISSGFAVTGFKLSDTILGIIAGSTAVSVIGLIGMVISGLFGKGPSAK